MNVDTSKRQRCLRRGCAAARLLRSRFRIPPKGWMSASCGCCVLSGRGLCVGPNTRPEESYRVWCVRVWSRSLDKEDALPLQRLSHLEQAVGLTRLLTVFNISCSKMGYCLFIYGTDRVTRCTQSDVFWTAKCQTWTRTVKQGLWRNVSRPSCWRNGIILVLADGTVDNLDTPPAY
jgi:hypothetical protein